MKINFYEIKDWEADYIKKNLTGHELSFSENTFNDASLPDSGADILSTFTSSPVTPKVLENCPNLKLVATRTTGFDHINLEATNAKSIVVSNVPTYGENTVAEFTFALLLSLSRKMYQGLKRIREQGLFNFEGLRGFDLKGKTIGVIGTGHIGTYVITIAHGFGMNIIAYDPHANEDLAKQFNYRYVSLNELLQQSDVITLHVPYMPATHHLLNAENMKQIKPGAVLINTARGGLVETSAMVEALKNKVLAGAAMDVIEEEGFVKDELNMLTEGHPNEEQLKTVLADHELMHMDNVLITPHTAFNTTEAIMRILDTTIKNIQSFVAGTPENVVTPHT